LALTLLCWLYQVCVFAETNNHDCAVGPLSNRQLITDTCTRLRRHTHSQASTSAASVTAASTEAKPAVAVRIAHILVPADKYELLEVLQQRLNGRGGIQRPYCECRRVLSSCAAGLGTRKGVIASWKAALTNWHLLLRWGRFWEPRQGALDLSKRKTRRGGGVAAVRHSAPRPAARGSTLRCPSRFLCPGRNQRRPPPDTRAR
jgi:hypothetical protein